MNLPIKIFIWTKHSSYKIGKLTMGIFRTIIVNRVEFSDLGLYLSSPNYAFFYVNKFEGGI